MLPEGNLLGWGMFVAGAIPALIGTLLQLPEPLTMMGVGLTIFLLDMGYRWRSRTQPKWLQDEKLGGTLFWFPVWVIGLVIIIVNIGVGLSETF